MKNRPAKWQDLPYSIQESIIGNCDLEYDSYESSRAEAIENLLNGNGYDNDDVVQHYYSQMSDDELFELICRNVGNLQEQLNNLIDFRNKLKE